MSLARETEWHIASIEAKKYGCTQRTMSDLSLKGWFGYRPTHRSLWLSTPLARTITLQQFVTLVCSNNRPSQHSILCKNLSHSTLCSCFFFVVTLNRCSQYRICTQQLQLHSNSSSFPGKICSKTSLTCSKKTPWQRAIASKDEYWLLSLVAFLPNFRVTTGFPAFHSKGKHLC